MQIARRPLAPGETDYELLWLGVSLGGLAFAALWFKLHLPWPICLFHALTGHPCATCGATRSAIAFFRADFLTSLQWNPLAFAFYSSLSIFDVYAFIAFVRRSRRVRISLASRDKLFLRISAVALLLANWIYLLAANPRV